MPVVMLNQHFEVYADWGKDSIYMILYAISIQYLIRNVQVCFFLLHKSNRKLQIRWGLLLEIKSGTSYSSLYFHNYKKKLITT